MTAKRVDANQPDVVKGLRALGMSVCVLSMVGDGCGDFLAGRAGVNVFIELKDGDKPHSARKLTPAETIFHKEWRGQIAVANTLEEVVEIVNREVRKRR